MPGYDQRITNSTNTPLSGRFSKTGKAVSSGGNSSAATQVQGRAQGVNFSQGQFVRGEVIDLRGHEIKIQLPDSHVLTGNIDDAVQLAIGEQATFRVTEASGSLVSLKLMTDPRAASTELTIDKALDAAGLPRSERNVSMVRALLDEGLSVDKNTIQLMLRQSANLRGISFHTLAILHKQGLPVNEVNARALTSYLNYEHRIMQLAERAAGEFTDTLSSLLNGGNAAEAEVLNSELLHMLFDNNNISGGDTAHGANINTSALDIAGGTSLPNLPAADLPLSSLALLTQEEALTLADTLEQAGLSRELCAAVANGSATLREVVQQILSLAENLLQNQNPSGGQTEMGGIGNPDGTVNNAEGTPPVPDADATPPDTVVPDTTEMRHSRVMYQTPWQKIRRVAQWKYLKVQGKRALIRRILPQALGMFWINPKMQRLPEIPHRPKMRLEKLRSHPLSPPSSAPFYKVPETCLAETMQRRRRICRLPHPPLSQPFCRKRHHSFQPPCRPQKYFRW